MNLSQLRAPRKANENKKRVGRGMGSGMGKTSTRGHDGQRSRSGSRMMRGFEGGQMPLHRRMPKRGFTNVFREDYTVVNLDRIAELGEETITLALLQSAGIANRGRRVKILGNGDVTTAMTIHAHKFSKSAEEKIVQAGGKIEIIALHSREQHSQTRPDKVRGPRKAASTAPRAEKSAPQESVGGSASESSAVAQATAPQDKAEASSSGGKRDKSAEARPEKGKDSKPKAVKAPRADKNEKTQKTDKNEK